MNYLKIILTSLVLLMLFINPLSAKENPRFEKQVRKKVSKKMDFPKNRMEGMVAAQFTVDSDGSLDILVLQSGHPDLQEYVKEELEAMTLNLDSIDTNRVFTFHFIFDKENIK